MQAHRPHADATRFKGLKRKDWWQDLCSPVSSRHALAEQTTPSTPALSSARWLRSPRLAACLRWFPILALGTGGSRFSRTLCQRSRLRIPMAELDLTPSYGTRF